MQSEVIKIHKKLTSIPEIPQGTQRVLLRRNLLTSIQLPYTPSIIELDLYDNKIKTITCLENIPNVKIIDLSFNLIKIINIPKLICLEELYLIGNDICELEKFELPNLKKLDLAENNLKEVCFYGLQLTELYLANNFLKFVDVKNMNLKVLDLQCNFIEKMDCKNLPSTLETLILNDNPIFVLDNLDFLVNLKFLGVLRTKLNIKELKTKAEIWHKL